MTPAAIAAGLRRMEEELARLRAQVATLTAAPATGSPVPGTFTDEEIEEYIVTTGAGCVLELAKDVQRARGEVYRLRASVVAGASAPATTTEPGLDLDERVPCASCGGEFVWRESPSDRSGPRYYDGRCRCGAEWCDMPAPVTWRTLTAYSDMEVPAVYVARLVSEVDRLRALLTASAPSSTAAPHSGAEPTVEAGAFAGRRACWDCRYARTPADCSRDWTEEIGAWIRANCPGCSAPSADARNCPGWAPKSGEVSNG